MRRAMLGFLITLLMVGTVAAQGGLQNSSLDEGSNGPYTTRRGGEFPIYLPNGWNVWLAGQSGDFYNRGDKTTINPHPGPGPSPRDGNRALAIDCGFVTCTVAVYQQVPVDEGANITASAWSQVKACNIAENADNCGSAVESGSQTRIGIDPNGGTSPTDSDIVWSNWTQPHDQWLQQSVSATTTGTTATLFLYSTQANTAQLNRTYWDATTLTGGGEGGFAEGGEAATPVPTAPPEVPFVVPQDARDDGSLIHTVSTGDTIDSIAVAYGLTRSDILALNPGITDPRIISLGQQIVIREPQAGSAPADDSGDEGGEDEPVNVPTVPSGGVNLEAEVTEQADGETTAGDSNTESDTAPTQAAPESNAESDDQSSTSPVTLTPAPVVAAGQPANDPSALAATVCVTLFEDANQNRLREPGEVLLPGGTIQIASGADSIGSLESALDPQCFEELASGNYIVSASAPAGYGLTSPNQFRLQALPGIQLDVTFGAAEGVVPVAPPPADASEALNEVAAPESDNPESPLDNLFNVSGLIIFGLAGTIFVVGMGLTMFLRRR